MAHILAVNNVPNGEEDDFHIERKAAVVQIPGIELHLTGNRNVVAAINLRPAVMPGVSTCAPDSVRREI